MLRVGLTGGIGAGKSAVSATFAQCGAIIVDGDVIAREVVRPGTEGLAALVEAFGGDILLPDGSLDRSALAAKAFGDEKARSVLNGIVHPLVGKRRAEIIASVCDDAVVVEDIPLLVESGMGPLFPLVVVVHADAEVRVRRLVEQRGMPEEDARARIAAQADDDQRRAVADVWLDNSGGPAELTEKARAVWNDRILPFARNINARRVARAPARPVPADPRWPAQARRIRARLQSSCGHRALRIDHVGSTVFSGYPAWYAEDVIDMQITVASLAVADELAESLLSAGYPRVEDIAGDLVAGEPRSTLDRYDHSSDPSLWHKRFHASADPGRPTNVHIRVDGWPNQQFALLLVDWLKADATARDEYLTVKRAAASRGKKDYAFVEVPWFLDAYRRAWEWADSTGWRP